MRNGELKLAVQLLEGLVEDLNARCSKVAADYNAGLRSTVETLKKEIADNEVRAEFDERDETDKRDFFAGLAMLGIYMAEGAPVVQGFGDYAARAYSQATAMIEAKSAYRLKLDRIPFQEDFTVADGNERSQAEQDKTVVDIRLVELQALRSDAEALRAVAAVLDGTEWTVDMLETIAEVCKLRGLRVRDL